MELKEKKWLKRKKFEKKEDSNASKQAEKDELDVFEFINQTLLVKGTNNCHFSHLVKNEQALKEYIYLKKKKDKVDKNMPEKSKTESTSLNRANSKGLDIKVLTTLTMGDFIVKILLLL